MLLSQIHRCVVREATELLEKYDGNIQIKNVDCDISMLGKLKEYVPVIIEEAAKLGETGVPEYQEVLAKVTKRALAELLGEKSKRCYLCYKQRLIQTAKEASNKYDYFTTTISISPYKVSKWLNEIGFSLEKEYNVKYLYSDFKLNNGYIKSIELSKKYGLYRQDYCGCEYSKNGN